MQILRPSCPTYCFDKNDCSGGTCENINERTCSAGVQFCPASGACWDSIAPSCAAPNARYDGTQRTPLNLVATVAHTLAAPPSYDYFALDLTTNDINVQPGDILAYKKTGGGILKSFASNTSESDLKTTDFSITTNAVNLGSSKRHLLRAVVSAGSIVKLPFLFTTFGTKTVDITLKNTALAVSVPLSETINVIEGIDMCALDVVEYAETGSVLQIQVLQHTGKDKPLNA